jgi:bifunctional DNA-binding transcriptional regulator/antitoxin component of YhaV-PrlF toxin-antitoxin module
MKKPLVKNEYLLQKFPGKGSWTYALIPEILQDKKAPFGWVKVKGVIDDYEIKAYRLMPMGNGQLFFPVKAAIRKKIGKQAGDYVTIILYEDDSIFEIPQEVIDCLKYDEQAYQKFMNLSERYQKEFIKWIYAAKKEDTKAQRINTTIDKVLKDKNLYDKIEC